MPFTLPLLVIEERHAVVEGLRARGIEALFGNASQPDILDAANLAQARWFISAIPLTPGHGKRRARAVDADWCAIGREAAIACHFRERRGQRLLIAC